MGTFHGFGLDLIRRYYDQLSLTSDPTLFDRSDAIAVLEEILPTLPLIHYRNLWDPALVLKDILSAISRAKDELLGADGYRALALTMRTNATDEESREAAEKCLEVADVYDRYEKAKADHQAVDFGDLIMRPTLLIESTPAIQAAIQLRHRHVLVDEYQDVNRASVRLDQGPYRGRQTTLGRRGCTPGHLSISRRVVEKYGRIQNGIFGCRRRSTRNYLPRYPGNR